MPTDVRTVPANARSRYAALPLELELGSLAGAAQDDLLQAGFQG